MNNSFELILAPFDFSEDEFADLSDKLYEAGCDDSTVCARGNVITIIFDREAATYQEAVDSAIKNVESVSPLRVMSCIKL